MTKQRRSNSVSMCTLPIIPEFPGFQDIKLSKNYSETPAFKRRFQDLERGKRSSPQLSNFPSTASLVRCLGSSSRSYLKGCLTTGSGFYDKPLEEYFSDRLMELRNYERTRSNRKTKVFAGKNQSPFLTHRSSQHRGSCTAVVTAGHGKESEEPCSSANQGNKKVIEHSDQEETQNTLDLFEGDFLDILTMHITVPLEAFLQKK